MKIQTFWNTMAYRMVSHRRFDCTTLLQNISNRLQVHTT